MTSGERRDKIIKTIEKSSSPVPAKALAEKFGVSRQVIVQDMAVIRAKVSGILSTNRGYIIQKETVYSREFKVRHDAARTEEELNLIVDCGGIIKTVSISHRVYNRITAQLNISSRLDVSEFLSLMEGSKSSALSDATSGYHYHLVEAASEERLDLIEEKLDKAGFLVPLLSWEQDT